MDADPPARWQPDTPMKTYIYTGSYTQPGNSNSQGIHIYCLDPSSGTLEFVEAAASGPNPSFMALHPNGRFLFAANELAEGLVSSFAVDPGSGRLSFLNRQPVHGSAPCYLTCDPTGAWLLAANYGDGSLSVLPVHVDGSLGSLAQRVQHYGLGSDPQRQEGPHAHAVVFDPSGRFVLAADLGIDRLNVYRFDGQSGQLLAHRPSGVAAISGAGPRHLVFHPNGRTLYVSNELNSTVTACSWNDQDGLLDSFQTLPTLPPGFPAGDAADIHLHPNGRTLYVSNRGHDSLAIFTVDQQDGSLIPNGHVSTAGKWPRNFALDPSGWFLLVANQHSDSLVIFRLDPQTGIPAPTGEIISVPSPVFVMVKNVA